MKIAADRPWSEKHEYRQSKLTISFRWEDGTNIPKSAVVIRTNEAPDNLVILGVISRQWGSYAEAVEICKRQAEKWLNEEWNFE